jgi:hypothetical protein
MGSFSLIILNFSYISLHFLADICRFLQIKTKPAKNSSSKTKKQTETQRTKNFTLGTFWDARSRKEPGRDAGETVGDA